MERTYLKRKQVDDVMGGADSWKNVDTTGGALPLLLPPFPPAHATLTRDARR